MKRLALLLKLSNLNYLIFGIENQGGRSASALSCLNCLDMRSYGFGFAAKIDCFSKTIVLRNLLALRALLAVRNTLTL